MFPAPALIILRKDVGPLKISSSLKAVWGKAAAFTHASMVMAFVVLAKLRLAEGESCMPPVVPLNTAPPSKSPCPAETPPPKFVRVFAFAVESFPERVVPFAIW
jgi:hypothetical protein